ncbi:hypothetical protein BK006_00430 [bacterium CG10_49_38]|nr:MAG: hypothetical protein BK006_00430 [bacterium CG10_49_38]
MLFIVSLSNYHEDLRTPGTLPSLANSRKQMRHKPKSLMKARLRPHRKQRCTILEENLGFFCDLAITDVLAIAN